jgi:phospholipase C
MAGRNIGDLLNRRGISWGSFMGGFDLTITNPNGTTGCARQTNPTAPGTPAFTSVDYIPHHAWFQYYASTRNPSHARPSSIAAIGHSLIPHTNTPEPANHQYDINDFFAALKAGNLPAVSFLKAAAFEDGHAGYSDPIDEQHFMVRVINALQKSPDWASTAVVIAYDDSDGWYDHQMPPVVNPSFNPTVDTLNGAGLCNKGPSRAHRPPRSRSTGRKGNRHGAAAAMERACRCWWSRRLPSATTSTTP